MFADEGNNLFRRFPSQVDQLMASENWQTQSFKPNRLCDFLDVKFNTCFFVNVNCGFGFEENHGYSRLNEITPLAYPKQKHSTARDACNEPMMRSSGPFREPPKLIFHGTYHKMGTVWLMRVLEKVASRWKLSLQKSNEHGDSLDPETDIIFANHSHLDPAKLGDFVGSHMIRDPRDCVVSGYFYHLWTDEAWVHQPQERFGGLSYQQHLKQLNQSDGLREEISNFQAYATTYALRDWDYRDDRIMELKYEDLLANELLEFEKLFRHYGFSEPAIKKAVLLARQCSFENVAKRTIGQSKEKSHLRSGRPGQWKEVLSADHVQLIEASFGDLIEQMGYK